MPPKLTKAAAVQAAKSFRQRLDALLQEMKEHRKALVNRNSGGAMQMRPASLMSAEEIEATQRARDEYEAEQFLDHGGTLPEILIGLPMGCLGFHAIREIREWWKL